MCGVAGFWQPGGFASPDAQAMAVAMAQRVSHRGPDDAGVWGDGEAGIALAHRRLAILDLSPAGRQPMLSAGGRYVVVFNGEIYNHLALRRKLETNAHWRGHSDTETLLAGFEAWGVEATLKQAVGMFAFALWDRGERALYLARDRMGEKPLYHGWQNGVFLFGSELKALKGYPSFKAEIDRGALALLLRHNYIPAPYSIYKDIRKLPPGTLLKLKVGDGQLAQGSLPDPVPYWSLSAVAEAGQREPFPGGDAEAISALEARLKESVGLQMVADVPLGAFLSGGVDSSTVVALMQAQSSRPVRTFTIGFNEAGYNEAEHAKAVARHLGTDHTELYVTPREAMDVIPRMPALYDEPFSDPSQIPTFLISQLARQHVTVSLSGDAGDELFWGYDRYFLAAKLWYRLRLLPKPARSALADVLTRLSPGSWDAVFGSFSRLIPAAWSYTNPGDKLHKLAEILAARTPDEIYLGLLSHWKRPETVVVGGTEPPTALTEHARRSILPDFESRMMYLDALSYLPDDILVKVDRAAMGVSLETRVPLLDHRVVEFAWRLPLSMKIRDGQGKWILRQVLYRHVPKALIERPKMGFGVPIDSWLRGPLRDWAESLLDESRIEREGFFRPGPIRRKWAEHLSGIRNWQYYLWDVLMFQAWLEG
jgi:asparagine synthase (glutamine-hydrolysing)